MSNQNNNSAPSEIPAQNTERASAEYNNVNTLLSNVHDVVNTFTDYGTFANNIPINPQTPQTRYLDLSDISEYSNVTNNTQDTSGYDSEVTNNTLYRSGYDDSDVTTTSNGNDRNVSRNTVDRGDYQQLSDNQKQQTKSTGTKIN
jgi:hypothetical protein